MLIFRTNRGENLIKYLYSILKKYKRKKNFISVKQVKKITKKKTEDKKVEEKKT